jgi:hypothetical protein
MGQIKSININEPYITINRLQVESYLDKIILESTGHKIEETVKDMAHAIQDLNIGSVMAEKCNNNSSSSVVPSILDFLSKMKD